MNDFELFTMIFYVVDSYYEDNPSDELRTFLGAMSPFTFKEVDSADSAIFAEFKRFVGSRTITIENSFDIAIQYSKTVTLCDITDAFQSITKEQWATACEDYLSRPHKGMSEQ